ncbi:hypothetical protein ACL2XG_24270 [Sodalis sp. RH24]|uniref:hypothetical protein n=1 Tax=unclassified Sodalis (in: enterobacteria) TaxID=2636512 RepID=UPI0039B62AF4
MNNAYLNTRYTRYDHSPAFYQGNIDRSSINARYNFAPPSIPYGPYGRTSINSTTFPLPETVSNTPLALSSPTPVKNGIAGATQTGTGVSAGKASAARIVPAGNPTKTYPRYKAPVNTRNASMSGPASFTEYGRGPVRGAVAPLSPHDEPPPPYAKKPPRDNALSGCLPWRRSDKK